MADWRYNSGNLVPAKSPCARICLCTLWTAKVISHIGAHQAPLAAWNHSALFPHSRCLLWATPRNSHLSTQGSAGGWDQALYGHISPHSPCTFFHAAGNSYIGAHQSLQQPGSDIIHTHSPVAPMQLSCSREFPHRCLPVPLVARIRHFALIPCGPCALWASLENSYNGAHRVQLVAKCQPHKCILLRCSGEMPWWDRPTDLCTLPVGVWKKCKQWCWPALLIPDGLQCFPC